MLTSSLRVAYPGRWYGSHNGDGMSATSVLEAHAEINRDEIIAHLGQVLADRRFASSERNASFLRFVVEATLAGRASEVKETVIATEVYGRGTTYDPKADSIVRVEASRLRQKLRSFYENEGQQCAIRFHLPSGSYVPSFDRVDLRPPAELEASPLPAETVEDPVALPRLPIGRIAAACACLVILLAVRRSPPNASNHSIDAEAQAAWQEGLSLLDLDPHSAQTAGGPPKTLLRAIERLEFATVRSPLRAPWWAKLAEAYDYASGFKGRDPAEDERRATAAATRAIELDPKFSEGYQMRGLMRKSVRWDFPAAERDYREALRLDPRNGYAMVEFADLLWETGRPGDAVEEVRRARALLPAFPALAWKEAELQQFLGRPDAAIVAAQAALEMQSTYMRAHVAMGAALEAKGEDERALESYRYVLQAEPSERRALPAYGYLLGRTGQIRQAREIAARLERINATVRNCAFQIAVVYAGLGEEKTALDWLETAWRTRQARFPFAAAEYRFRRFHQNPRFLELLSRTGQKPVRSQ